MCEHGLDMALSAYNMLNLFNVDYLAEPDNSLTHTHYIILYCGLSIGHDYKGHCAADVSGTFAAQFVYGCAMA